MNDHPPEQERDGLPGYERAFVDRIEESYRAPQMDAPGRVAFREALDERIASGGRRRSLQFALGAAAALCLAVWGWNVVPNSAPDDLSGSRQIAEMPVPDVTPGASAGVANESGDVATTPEEALLSLAFEPLSDEAASLPDDYEAIASLFLGS